MDPSLTAPASPDPITTPLGLAWHELGSGWEYAWSPIETAKPYLLHHCPTVGGAGRGFEVSFAARHTVQAREPLTLSPSVICTGCGDHGFIHDGKWVPV